MFWAPLAGSSSSNNSRKPLCRILVIMDNQ